MKNRFNALIANTNGLFLMEQEGQMPVQNAAVQICIDRIKKAVRPGAAVSGEAEAKEQGLSVRIEKFPWAASGRALGVGRAEGLTKLIFDEEGGAPIESGGEDTVRFGAGLE